LAPAEAAADIKSFAMDISPLWFIPNSATMKAGSFSDIKNRPTLTSLREIIREIYPNF
jgi:hypothetical protein